MRLAPTPGQLPASAWLIDLRHSALPSTIGLQTYGALPLGMGYTISLSPDQTESQVLDMLYDNLTHVRLSEAATEGCSAAWNAWVLLHSCRVNCSCCC